MILHARYIYIYLALYIYIYIHIYTLQIATVAITVQIKIHTIVAHVIFMYYCIYYIYMVVIYYIHIQCIYLYVYHEYQVLYIQSLTTHGRLPGSIRAQPGKNDSKEQHRPNHCKKRLAKCMSKWTEAQRIKNQARHVQEGLGNQ